MSDQPQRTPNPWADRFRAGRAKILARTEATCTVCGEHPVSDFPDHPAAPAGTPTLVAPTPDEHRERHGDDA